MEGDDRRVLGEDGSHDFALHTDAAAVNDTDLAKPALGGLVQIFLHDDMDLCRLKRMQVDGVFDRNFVHPIQYNDRFMKYFVRTYGCQMNVADSNEMSRHLQSHGLVETLDQEDASVILVNTCTVRQHAEDRAFSEIGRLKKWKAKRPGRKVVVTGCAAERTKEYLEGRFPFIDLVVGAKSIENFEEMAQRLLDRRATDEELDYAVPAIDDKVAAFVTIMRGCNYSCTYCIVPYVRGREIYHSIDQIIGEVRDRAREGAREITLLGQTVNSYRHEQYRFADLLRAVAAEDGVDRVRFISPHPYYMSDRVVEAMAEVPEICEGLHLPVQSGSNIMLKAMARNYTREQYVSLIEKMRRAMPEMALSTDIIVGFPGETEEDFQQTLSLIEEVRFDWGFIFKYSTREGTPAAQLESYPDELIEERHRRCLELVDRIAMDRRLRLVGTMQDVLVEEENFGRTRANYKVHINGNVAPGQEVSVRITNAQRATLEGELQDGNVTFENFRQENTAHARSRER